MLWYNTPKQTGKVYLTEPTTYPVNGKNVTMASVYVPIMRDGTFVGLVSIDTELSYLQNEIANTKIMGGYTQLLSSKGLYVAYGRMPKKVDSIIIHMVATIAIMYLSNKGIVPFFGGFLHRRNGHVLFCKNTFNYWF